MGRWTSSWTNSVPKSYGCTRGRVDFYYSVEARRLGAAAPGKYLVSITFRCSRNLFKRYHHITLSHFESVNGSITRDVSHIFVCYISRSTYFTLVTRVSGAYPIECKMDVYGTPSLIQKLSKLHLTTDAEYVANLVNVSV